MFNWCEWGIKYNHFLENVKCNSSQRFVYEKDGNRKIHVLTIKGGGSGRKRGVGEGGGFQMK